MKLDGCVSLVTGAGHRLGRAIALALARAGSDLVVHYGRSREEAEATAGDIRALGREATLSRADLARPSEIEALFRGVAERLGRLDVLVNNAASFERHPFDDISVEDWDRVMAVNLRAPFLCSQHAARLMRGVERRGSDGEPGAPGLIVNLGDLSGLRPWVGYAHHGVSKAGLLHLTRVLARELGPEVRANAVVPGPILPPPGEDPEGLGWTRRGTRLPLGRTGEPAQIGDTVVFLAENDFMTGEMIVVDGGESLMAGGRDEGAG